MLSKFIFFVFPFRDEIWRAVKRKAEYGRVLNAVEEAKRRKEQEAIKLPMPPIPVGTAGSSESTSAGAIESVSSEGVSGRELAVPQTSKAEDNTVRALLPARAPMVVKPKWHPPWKLYRLGCGGLFNSIFKFLCTQKCQF